MSTTTITINVNATLSANTTTLYSADWPSDNYTYLGILGTYLSVGNTQIIIRYARALSTGVAVSLRNISSNDYTVDYIELRVLRYAN